MEIIVIIVPNSPGYFKMYITVGTVKVVWYKIHNKKRYLLKIRKKKKSKYKSKKTKQEHVKLHSLTNPTVIFNVTVNNSISHMV